MISYSESYLKQLVSVSCCWLLATKVRAKKREICSSSSISIDIRMYLSNWFYSRPQIEPTKWEKDYWNPIIPIVLFRCIIVKRLLSQRNAANRSTFLSIRNFGIHLCRCHILVTEITLYNRNTCSCVQLETGKAVAWAMIGNMLGNPCFSQPVLQWCLCHGVFEIGEHLASFIRWIANQFQGFLTDWVMHDVFCLLHSCSDIHHTIAAVWLYFLPSEFLNVALSQCR